MSKEQPQVKSIRLGQVAGVVISETAPSRKNVIWAKPLDPNDDTQWLLYFWNGNEWVSLATRMIGEIMFTGLTLAQAQSQLGADAPNWLLADGQSAAGTTYETVTGNANVPDLSPVVGQAILIKVD